MIEKAKIIHKLIAGKMWLQLGLYILCDFIAFYLKRRKEVKEVYEEEEKPRRRKRRTTKKSTTKTEE